MKSVIILLVSVIMASVDKRVNKLAVNSQADNETRMKDEMKSRRRGKPQVEIYRPGSGPLRKSIHGDGEIIQDGGQRSRSYIESPHNISISNEHKNVFKKTSCPVPQDQHTINKQSSKFREPAEMSKSIGELSNIDEKMRIVQISSSGSVVKNSSGGQVFSGTNTKSAMNDSRKKTRKPEQALYVPKPLALVIAERDTKIRTDDLGFKVGANSRDQINSVNRGENLRRSKCEGMRDGEVESNWDEADVGRQSNNVRDNERLPKHLWKLNPPVSDQLCNQRRREGREASEPRSMPPASLSLDLNRMRDSKSVEPVGRCKNEDILQRKPPSGRRDNVKDCNTFKHNSYYESLPPRLKKKLLAQNVEPETGTSFEGMWDGSTVMFQGSGGNYKQQQQRVSTVERQDSPQVAMPEHWAHTLPNSHTRGRGRLRPEELEAEKMVSAFARFSRSLTPDRMLVQYPTVSDFGSPCDLKRVPTQESKRGPGFETKSPTGVICTSANNREDQENKQNGSYKPADSGNRIQDDNIHNEIGGTYQNQNRDGISSRIQDDNIHNEIGGTYQNQNRDDISSRIQDDSIHNEFKGTYQNENRDENNIEESVFSNSISPSSPKILDWGEEVDLDDQLEGERRLNRMLERSSSFASLQDQSQTSLSRSRRRRHRRSLSRDQSVRQDIGTRSYSSDRNMKGSFQDQREKNNRKRGRSRGRSNQGYNKERMAKVENEDVDSCSNSKNRIKAPPSKENKIKGGSKEKKFADGTQNEHFSNYSKARKSNDLIHEPIKRCNSRDRSNDEPRKRYNSRDRSKDFIHEPSKRCNSRDRSNDEPRKRYNSRDRSKDLIYEPSKRCNSRDRSKDEPRKRYNSRDRSKDLIHEPSKRSNSRDRSKDEPSKRCNSRDRSKDFIYEPSKRCNSRDQSKDLIHEPSNRCNSRDQSKNLTLESSKRCNSRDQNKKCQRADSYHGKVKKEQAKRHENWREEQQCQQLGREVTGAESLKLEDSQDISSGNHVAGILVIPPSNSKSNAQKKQTLGLSPHQTWTVKTPEFLQQQQSQRQLFDPNNPGKPIIVSSPGGRASQSLHSRNSDISKRAQASGFPASHPLDFGYEQCSGIHPSQDHRGSFMVEQFGYTRPAWYDHYSSSFRSARYPHLLLDIERADLELQWIFNTKGVLPEWNRIAYIRQFLQQCLETLLIQDIKFCQTENVEQHFWKILFYNVIELLRKGISEDGQNKEQYKQTMLALIDQGTMYLENLLEVLEQTFKFKLETYLSPNNVSTKGLGFAGLALVSAQKLLIFLGDLARYKEQVNETSNFGKSRQYYIKAHQINPKNGRPYNQLAILAVYARRKLDAVYYYMRSLMASNPFQSARESLLSLFDESRKKYQQAEKRRQEERNGKSHEKIKIKEGAGMESGGNGLRREYWVHPEAGRPRLHITSTVQEQHRVDSDEEELTTLSSVEVNRRFVTSYLHVHGKLFTKIGMETFHEAAQQMLREFRALLQHTPVALNSTRFLQLLALNMFAIENTQLKEAAHLEPSYRSAVQESALIVSLQMFNLILEKCVSLLKEQFQLSTATQPVHLIASEDMKILLPAVKVWCDWLLCHSSVWNPPPSCTDYQVGPAGDAWSRLASLVNLLDKLEHQKTVLVSGMKEDFELVRLPEDAMLYGFTPLMYNDQEPIYTGKDTDMDLAQIVLRIRKIIFFGTVFLCGVDPPVLKLQKFDSGFSEYVSIVQSSTQESSSVLQGDESDSELVVESFSEDEDEDESKGSKEDAMLPHRDPEASSEIQNLLHRKEELEQRHKKQEKYRKRVQEILRDTVVSVEIEVKPHNLVPDTNCFIDYLSQLKVIATAGPSPEHYYTLMVPLVVLKELEGLARGGKDKDYVPVSAVNQFHAAKVAEAAKQALAFLRSRSPGVRCVTTRGRIVPTTAFAMEEDTEQVERNDDKILATSLSLCKVSGKDYSKPGEPRRLYREVVLLTEDRNLRVKALARHVPVREVPDFMQWAGLG